METGHQTYRVEPLAFSVATLPAENAGNTEPSTRVRECVRQVLSQSRPQFRGVERRRDRREPFPYPVYLTPVERDGTIVSEKTLVVIGKQLSESGIDFYNRDPLPYRRVIASFETVPGQWIGIMTDLTWCRFGRHGWYDNGGRFIAQVRSPMTDVAPPPKLPA